MEQTFEATLVRQCALTLAGMKPGSLFCIAAPDPQAVRRKTEQWDSRLRPLGLKVQILLERPQTHSALVYVFRPCQLVQTLSAPDCRDFLQQSGYRWGALPRLLDQLSHRLREQEDFPHEIGVFLGYPLEDVQGFIRHRGKNFTCCGLWKSYGDPSCMERCFACYRSCIQTYVNLYEQGTPIESLAVSA